MSRNFILKRIRLLNFHNFLDETITLNGHLFLLGGNGSGKTTILDSVHFALTAGGQRMELNSAARMGEHARNLGRTLQGIFLRYDLEKGQRNEDKTIGYVGLEFAKPDSDERFCIGCGALATSMQAAPQIWGFEAAVPLDKLVLTETIDGKKFTVNQDTLKASGYKVYSRERYIEVIAAKFFDSIGSYRETMKLIAAGKSYRELVGRIKDQSQLFRELLPPPDESGYRKIQSSLQEIERMQENLKDQKTRLDSLGALTIDLDEAIKVREKVARLAYMSADSRLEAIRTGLAAENERKIRAESDAEQNQKDIESLSGEIDLLEARIEADKNSALYRDQQLLIEIKREFDRNALRQNDVEKRLAAHHSDLEKLNLKAKATGESIEDYWQNLESRFVDAASLLDGHEFTVGRSIEDYQSQYQKISQALSDRRDFLNADLASLEYRQKEIEKKILVEAQKISNLKKQKEAFPAAARFDELEARLNAEKIGFVPLFRMLEPATDMTGAVARVIEELIGPQRLCTIFVPESGLKRARAEIVAEPFDIAVHTGSEGGAPAALPGGLRRFINFAGAHAGRAEAYLAALLDKFRYVVSEDIFWKSPEENLVCANGLIRENGTVRRVEASSNRYIGSAAREATRQAQIEELEARKHELEIDLGLITTKLNSGRENLSAVLRSISSLNSIAPEFFARLQQQYFDIRDNIASVTARLTDEEKNLAELAHEQMER
ncbi:MAG: ATP-binding protein, partial [Candidatus Riflebacteria bacterium]|nr:ATP-binding protein [Candidatus Riflebacteria bacterium]